MLQMIIHFNLRLNPKKIIPTHEPTFINDGECFYIGLHDATNHTASDSTTDPTNDTTHPTSNSINKAALSLTETAECYRLNQFIISTAHKNI